MEDRFLKYSKLYILLFLSFLSIPVVIALLMGIFYGFSKIISSSVVDFLFELLIISLPAAVFCTAYFIFIKRTRHHPVAAVRIISMLFFAGALACNILFLFLDIISFFKHRVTDVGDSRCFGIFFLAGNIAGLFLIAIVQAFTTQQEEDWLEKRKEKDISALN